MAMTKTKLLALARRTSTKKGFKVEIHQILKRKKGMGVHVTAWEVRLDSDVGFPNSMPRLLTTENQATACEARDRFWMWLRAEGLTRD